MKENTWNALGNFRCGEFIANICTFFNKNGAMYKRISS